MGGVRMLPWERGEVERALDSAADGRQYRIPFATFAEGRRWQQAIYREGRARGVLVRTRVGQRISSRGRAIARWLDVLPPKAPGQTP